MLFSQVADFHPQNAMSFYLQNYILHAKEYLSLSIPQFISCSGISISYYLQFILTPANICIFLPPRLFLHPVIFISIIVKKIWITFSVSSSFKNQSILLIPFFYFGLYHVYLRRHFLPHFYWINKSNYL